MKLIECYIENFGKLSGFKYTFDPGMNSIKKDNGYGKTTLSVFIKAMLYGLEDTKRQKIETNDRKHYMPWQGGISGGYLIFENGNKRYRVERTFSVKAAEDTFKLYDQKSGKECFDYSSELGEELFGIDADGFERTVFLSEQNLSGKNENKTVSAKLSDLVGADGDIGVMDDALLILEKERKAYHRRGGAGEIGDIKKRIGTLTVEANDLARIKADYEDDKKKLSEVDLELVKLKKKKAELDTVSKRIEEERLKRTYVKHYSDMKRSLEEEAGAKSELEKFFIKGIPSESELNEIKAKDAELKRLSMLDGNENKSYEYRELDTFFSGGVNDGDIEKLSYASAVIDSRTRQKRMLEAELYELDTGLRGYDTEYPELNEYSELILALTKAPKNKSAKGTKVGMAIGIGLTLLGFILGILIKPILFILSALGASLLAVSTALSLKNTNNNLHSAYDKARDLVGDTKADDHELINALYNKKAEAERFSELCGKRAELISKISEANEDISARSREACEFISKFPVKSTDSIIDATAEIIKKRDLYLALKSTENRATEAKAERDAKRSELADAIRAFVQNFKVSTPYPLEEIERKMLEHTSLSRSVERIRTGMESFAKEHGLVSDGIENIAARDSEAHESEVESVLRRISDFERVRAVLERQCRESEAELERMDDVKCEIEALSEKEKEYEKRLHTVLLTQKYLTEAKDLLTSKYLSKTKSAFNGYVELLAKELGEEFTMDTSFEVAKSDRGALRPTEAYSRGVRDLYYLSARLALVDSLYENEEPFIILDDPFAHFDDKRLKAGIALLSQLSKKKQVIYLTCASAREI